MQQSGAAHQATILEGAATPLNLMANEMNADLYGSLLFPADAGRARVRPSSAGRWGELTATRNFAVFFPNMKRL
jgi:hypothetical protein